MGTSTDNAGTVERLARSLGGRFIAFEGADGSGKSTQLRRLADALRAAGAEVCEVREPGGTAVGERVRDILLHRDSEMSLRCEMLLYMASRSQLVEERIRPALARGHIVLADRFVSSTYAYQGAGGGLPEADITAAAAVATGGTMPHVVLVFDVDEATALRRTRGVEKAPRGKGKPVAGGVTLFDDRIEQRGMEFQRRVRASYLEQARARPDAHRVIDARGGPEDVWRGTLEALDQWAGAARDGQADRNQSDRSGAGRSATP